MKRYLIHPLASAPIPAIFEPDTSIVIAEVADGRLTVLVPAWRERLHKAFEGTHFSEESLTRTLAPLGLLLASQP